MLPVSIWLVSCLRSVSQLLAHLLFCLARIPLGLKKKPVLQDQCTKPKVMERAWELLQYCTESLISAVSVSAGGDGAFANMGPLEYPLCPNHTIDISTSTHWTQHLSKVSKRNSSILPQDAMIKQWTFYRQNRFSPKQNLLSILLLHRIMKVTLIFQCNYSWTFTIRFNL